MEQKFREQFLPKMQEVKTADQLAVFLEEINKFQHDYGSIIIACAFAMKAAMQVVDNGPQGGITGFQGSAVFWEVAPLLGMLEPGAPARFLAFDKMLYPQYEERFGKYISPETMDYLKEKAVKNLEEHGNGMNKEVSAHMKSIAKGKPPFGYSIRKT